MSVDRSPPLIPLPVRIVYIRLLILLVVDVVLQAAIVVAIASSAFIVFVIPHSTASSPQRVIGGHVVAVIVGTAFSALHLTPVLGELAVSHNLF